MITKEIHVHYEFPEEIKQSLLRMERMIAALLTQGVTMTAEFQKVVDAVAALKSADQSLILLVQSLAQLIRDTAGDREAALALANEVDAEAATVAQAVTDNTPNAGRHT